MYFALTSGNKEELEECKVSLKKQLKPFGACIQEYEYSQKNSWQKLTLLNPWGIRQTRLIQTGHIAAMNPFYRDESIPDYVEVGSKEELLAVFDAMTEEGDIYGAIK